jgi:hypothetical protein
VLIANGQFFSVTNNFIENNVNGVYLWNAHCGTIQNNNIRICSNPDTGVKIGGNSSYNSIKMNKIWVRDNLTAQYGIREMDSADYNNISYNDIISNPTTFVSDLTTNSVGTILTQISTIGTHTTVSGNNTGLQEAQPTQTPTTASTLPTATPTATTTPQPTSTQTEHALASQSPQTTESANFVPWPFVVLLSVVVAGGIIVPFLFKRKDKTGFKL